jgi:hypothetical protein
MFHPLSLEQQSVYYSPADVEMLQNQAAAENAQQMAMEYSGEKAGGTAENGTGAENVDQKQLKRKKFLEAQLKSVKKGANQSIPVKKEEKKRKEVKKESRKEKKRWKPPKTSSSRRREIIQVNSP